MSRPSAVRVSVSSVVALLLLSSSQASTQKSCSKLREHLVVAESVYVKNGIYWNDTKITPTQFETYLRSALKGKTNEVIEVRWAPHEEENAGQLVKRMRARGLEVATNCPPIPF